QGVVCCLSRSTARNVTGWSAQRRLTGRSRTKGDLVDTTRIGLSADNADLGFSSRVRSWLRHRSARADDWTASELCALKGERTVTVVIPARDEERAGCGIAKTRRTAVM